MKNTKKNKWIIQKSHFSALVSIILSFLLHRFFDKAVWKKELPRNTFTIGALTHRFQLTVRSNEEEKKNKNNSHNINDFVHWEVSGFQYYWKRVTVQTVSAPFFISLYRFIFIIAFYVVRNKQFFYQAYVNGWSNQVNRDLSIILEQYKHRNASIKRRQNRKLL